MNDDTANACFAIAGLIAVFGGWRIFGRMDWVEYAPTPEELKRMKEREQAFNEEMGEYWERMMNGRKAG